MSKTEEQHLVEPGPERGQTGNTLLDSDVEVKQVLALPTPPSSKRRLVANFDSELAGAQTTKSFGKTGSDVIGLAPLITTPTYEQFILLGHASGGEVR